MTCMLHLWLCHDTTSLYLSKWICGDNLWWKWACLLGHSCYDSQRLPLAGHLEDELQLLHHDLEASEVVTEHDPPTSAPDA